MSNIKAHENFDILFTADGSPTLAVAHGEKMHSMDGAFSESLYIYGSAIEKALHLPSPKVLSMGLGLGYNELLTLSYFLKNNIHDFFIASYEKETFLIEYFLKWLHHETNPLSHCYQQIASRLEEKFEFAPGELRAFAEDRESDMKIHLYHELTPQNETNQKFHSILYDAYSGKTDSELWQQDYLENFIVNYCDTSFCNFTTYAATGNLTRALKAQGFTVEKKSGYGNKRESTYALRLSS